MQGGSEVGAGLYVVLELDGLGGQQQGGAGVVERERASAQAARLGREACGAGRLGGPVGNPRLSYGQRSCDEGEGQEDGAGGEEHAESADHAGLGLRVGCEGGLFVVGCLSGGVEEVAFVGRELAVGGMAPFLGLGQPGPAVELAGGAAQGVPRVSRTDQVVADPLPLDVVVQPAAESGPGAGEGFVGDLDQAFFAGDEAGGDEEVDEVVLGGLGGDQSAGEPGADRFGGGSGRDQAEEHVAQQVAFGGVDLLVEGLGGLGDRALDAAGGLVAGHGQGVGLAAAPGLGQRVGQQRQRAGFVLDLAHQEIDQPGFEDQALLPGG